MTVDLGEPDADNNRFPVRLQHSGKSWSTWWNYTDRNIAKDFYRTRTYLKADGLFQIEEAAKPSTKLTAARVTHPGTKETRDFGLETPKILTEIDQLARLKEEQTTAEKTSEQASRTYSKIKVIKTDGQFIVYGDGTVMDKQTGRKWAPKDNGLNVINTLGQFIVYEDGTVLDTRTSLMWAATDNGSRLKWTEAQSYCFNYRGGGGYTGWRMPNGAELENLYAAGAFKNAINLTGSRFFGTNIWTDKQVFGSSAVLFSTRSGRADGAMDRSGDATCCRALPVRSVK